MGTNKSLKTILAGIDSKYNAEQLDKVNKQLDAELSNDRKKTSKSIKNLYNPNTNEIITPAQQTNAELKKLYDEGLRKKGALTETKDEAGNVTSSSIDVSKLLSGNLKKDNLAMKLYMKHYGNKDLENYKNNPQMGITGDANTDIAKTIVEGFNPRSSTPGGKVSDELSKLYTDSGFGDELSAARAGKYTGGYGHRSDVDYFQTDKPFFAPMTRGYQGTTKVDWGRLGYDKNPTTGDKLRNDLFSSPGYLAKEEAKKKSGKNWGTSK